MYASTKKTQKLWYDLKKNIVGNYDCKFEGKAFQMEAQTRWHPWVCLLMRVKMPTFHFISHIQPWEKWRRHYRFFLKSASLPSNSSVCWIPAEAHFFPLNEVLKSPNSKDWWRTYQDAGKPWLQISLTPPHWFLLFKNHHYLRHEKISIFLLFWPFFLFSKYVLEMTIVLFEIWKKCFQ